MKKAVSVIISLLLLTAAGVIAFRLIKRPAPVPADEDAAASPSVRQTEAVENPYRQDDPAWADDRLGGSKFTMKSSGCVVSCIAAALSYGGEAVTPGELNRLLSENGVYDGEGNLRWDSLDSLDGFAVKVYGAADTAYVDECLAAGRYPIIRVKTKSGRQHYVLVTGGEDEDGDYDCMDPLRDGATALKDYGGEFYAVRCVWKEKPEQ